MGKHKEEGGGKTGSAKGGSQDPSPTHTAASCCVILFCVSVVEEYFIPSLGIFPKQFPSSS